MGCRRRRRRAGRAGRRQRLAAAGARTVVLERAEHPRYKTCGGGLLGVSRAAVAGQITLPVRDEVRSATFTLRGGQEFSRSNAQPLLTMVMREEFDAALLGQAEENGAVVRQRVQVRSIEQADGRATARLADGSSVTATVLIGADGSSGVTARHVGAQFAQVDLGLELEIAVPEPVGRRWAGRLLLDWGEIPGSYGWVFPKGDRLTVGVIAARGHGDATKAYLREFVGRLGLGGYRGGQGLRSPHPLPDRESPLRRGRVIVAGDAAGLLEPWTREGISFALRSGALAGEYAAKAATAGDPATTEPSLDGYAAAVNAALVPDMRAGRVLLSAFTRHAGTFHKGLSTAKGWGAFVKLCRSERSFAELVNRPAARLALSLISRLLPGRTPASERRAGGGPGRYLNSSRPRGPSGGC